MDSLIISKIKEEINQSTTIKQDIYNNVELINKISQAVELSIRAYNTNNKIMIVGNGGSAADAQHFAGELVSRFNFDRPGLNAQALTTDTSTLTAIGNDYGYEKVFSRQIQACGNENDILFAISTSGNSENILHAINQSKKQNIITIGLTGNSGGKMKDLCDLCICVPSDDTPRIQESHLMIEHIICGQIENEIFGN
tara:strand:- start:384 stop:974 length:591 start_codon:yes stop_codon:yes gene_type:complete